MSTLSSFRCAPYTSPLHKHLQQVCFSALHVSRKTTALGGSAIAKCASLTDAHTNAEEPHEVKENKVKTGVMSTRAQNGLEMERHGGEKEHTMSGCMRRIENYIFNRRRNEMTCQTAKFWTLQTAGHFPSYTFAKGNPTLMERFTKDLAMYRNILKAHRKLCLFADILGVALQCDLWCEYEGQLHWALR